MNVTKHFSSDTIENVFAMKVASAADRPHGTSLVIVHFLPPALLPELPKSAQRARGFDCDAVNIDTCSMQTTRRWLLSIAEYWSSKS